MSASESEDLDPEDEEPDAEDQPEIEDDEMADWGDVADDVAESDEDDQDDESDEETTDQGTPSMDPADAKTSIGDVYCNALGMGAAVARDRYGDLDEDRGATMDEYADMARQLEIDEYVDDWLAEQGGIDELSPGQGAVVMSVLFMMMVAVEDPTIAENALEGVSKRA